MCFQLYCHLKLKDNICLPVIVQNVTTRFNPFLEFKEGGGLSGASLSLPSTYLHRDLFSPPNLPSPRLSSCPHTPPIALGVAWLTGNSCLKLSPAAAVRLTLTDHPRPRPAPRCVLVSPFLRFSSVLFWKDKRKQMSSWRPQVCRQFSDFLIGLQGVSSRSWKCPKWCFLSFW